MTLKVVTGATVLSCLRVTRNPKAHLWPLKSPWQSGLGIARTFGVNLRTCRR